MATTQRGLLDRWLTINNQGNDSSTGEGDGAGPTTDWGKLLNLDFEQMRRLGYMGNVPAQNSTDGGDQQGNPMQEAQDWMRQSGYSYGINPTENGGQFNTWLDPQGQEVAGTQREFAAPNDNAFWAAAMAAGALVGGAAGGGLGNIGSSVSGGALTGNAALGAGGATVGGVTGAFNSAVEGENILKGGLKGAAIGGLGAYGGGMLSDAISPYIPDSVRQFMGGQGVDMPSGMDLAADGGFNSAGSAAAQFSPISGPMEVPQFNPADYYSGAMDPTNALQQLPDMAQMPGQMPSMGPAELAPFAPSANYGGDNWQFPQAPEALPQIPQNMYPALDNSITQSLANLPQLPQVPAVPFPSLQTQSPAPEQQPQQPRMPSGSPDPMGDYMRTGGAEGSIVGNSLTGAGGAAGAIGAGTVASAIGGAGQLLDGLGGLKTLLPIAGAIAGSQPSGGGTATTQQRTDPRFDKYLYDSFLPEWQKQFDANKGGVNDTMKAGWNQQLGLLNDPQIASQLGGMRGQGLLQSQGSVAGNPFSDGRMSLGGGAQGLLGGWNQQPQQPQGLQAGGPGGRRG